MRTSAFRTVMAFTIAYGLLAISAIAAQPRAAHFVIADAETSLSLAFTD